ncbi:MAG TPA: hypothetical protein PK156_01000 [Polyangium sp.]|nr:hypothetical protein [Polyangium sp.]
MVDPTLLVSWQESIDPMLLRRLVRPLEQPGVISLDISKRIVAWVDYFSERLVLLQELSKKRGSRGHLQTKAIPMVHARWVAREIVHERTSVIREKNTEIVVPQVLHTVHEHQKYEPLPRIETNSDLQLGVPQQIPQAQSKFVQNDVSISRALRSVVAPQSVPLSDAAIPLPRVGRPRPLVAMENAAMPVIEQVPVVETMSKAVAKPFAVVENAAMPVAQPLAVVETMSKAVAKPLVVVENVSTPFAKSPASNKKAPPVVKATFFKVTDVSNMPSNVISADTPPVVRANAPNIDDSRTPAELPHVGLGPSGAAMNPDRVEVAPVANNVRIAPAAVVEPQATKQAVPPPPAPELDVDVLVDKVEKKLLRRIVAERDRRGGFQ